MAGLLLWMGLVMSFCLRSPKSLLGWLIAVCGLAGGGSAAGQVRAVPALPPTRGLSRMVQSSGYIFSGSVSAIAIARAVPANSGEVGTVKITFRVEQAIRGVRQGQTLEIREWAGLWESGPRYHLGERVLLFLYPPSRLGLTSPVGGAMGHFNLDSAGQVILRPPQAVILRPSPEPLVPILRPGSLTVTPGEFIRAIGIAGRP